MKKIIFSLILLIGIAIKGLAQDRQVEKLEPDNLKQELAMARHDTTRVLIMVDLCTIYRLSDPDSALYYGQQALTLAKKIRFPKGELLALSFQSFVVTSIGNLPRSLEMGLKALQLAEGNQLQEHTTPTLNNIGGIYRTLGDLPKALTYFKQQMIVGAILSNKSGLAYSELAIGGIFLEMNQLDSSAYYLKKSLEHFNSLDRVEPHVFTGLGDMEMKSGNTSLALDYYRKSLTLSIQYDEPTRTSSTYNSISGLYKIIDQRDSSIYYAKKGLATAQLTSQIEVVGKAASLLSELYEATDAKEALRYYKIATAAKDSLLGSASIQAVQLIVAQEQERQKEMELTKIAFQNQVKQYAALAGLVFFLLVAFILYRNNRQKQKANGLLQQQKEEIDMQRNKAEKSLDKLQSTQAQLIQSEKMASLGELTAGIAHEIQNPLNFVNNFSEINKDLLDELKGLRLKRKEESPPGRSDRTGDEQAETDLLKDIEDNEQKILQHGKRADAIVKGMLQHSQKSSGVKEPTDINLLAEEYYRLAYHSFKAKEKFPIEIKLIIDFDANLPLVNIIPQDIGRVLLNLYNNAFWACKIKSEGVTSESPLHFINYHPAVNLSTKKHPNKIEIRILDNGPGISQNIIDKIFQPFFTTKPTGQGTGLGLSLSYDIVNAHGGDLTVKSVVGERTEFIISLPTQNVQS